MSSRNTKKNAHVAKTNSIITRNRSAQQKRQLRAKNNNKVIEKPVNTKPNKPETKSTKAPNETCRKDTPLKTKMRQLVELVEQAEYHPDKLKRNLCIKKILLKPKHNFKVIASTNKRKLAVPQKGGLKSPQPIKRLRINSSKSAKRQNGINKIYNELSMIDMVKLMEEQNCLSDEDFMEILTCPSPVWWEDPPDDDYIEEAICTRQPDTPPESSLNKNNTEENKTNTPSNDLNNSLTSTPTIGLKNSVTNTPTNDLNSSLTDFENEIEEFKIMPTKKPNGEKFVKKRQKLENILGNIKNVKNNDVKNKNKFKNDEILKIKEKSQNNDVNIDNRKVRRLSTSTDGEDLSDLSFNEEEILKHLENIDIPIEQIDEQTKNTDVKIVKDIKGVKTVKKQVLNIKNKVAIPDKLPPLTRKPDLKNKMKSDCSDSNEFVIDNVCSSNFRFISDDDITCDESTSTNSVPNEKMKIVNISSSLGESSSIIDVDTIDTKEYEIKKEQNEINTNCSDKNNDLPKKVANDLSEYITVYKIMSHDNEKNEIITENKSQNSDSSNNNNLDNVRGKLNSFFKKCKSNKRLKKSDPFPTSMTGVKDLNMEKENSDEQVDENDKNRLKPCDYCVVKSGSGTKQFSCEKCEKAPIFACNLCNFLADTKETYKKHVSSCKDVPRISWNRSYLMNQT